MIVALLAACGAAASVILLGMAFVSRSASPLPTHEVEVAPPRRGRERPPWIGAIVQGGLAAAGGWFVAGSPGLVAGLGAGAIPIVVERRRAARRAELVQEQLIDAVAAIASAFRSGHSLAQSFGVAGGEVDEPLGGVFREVADRTSLGVPIEEVLGELEARIGGADGRLVGGVLRMHRRTGGALSTTLDDLTKTLRARRDGARELRSLTAQARLSATILGLLPLGFFLFLSVVARRDVEAAYRTTAGVSAIGVGFALQGAAFLWIRRILRVEET